MSASDEGGEEGDRGDFDEAGDGAGGGQGVEVGLGMDCQEVSGGRGVGLIAGGGGDETTREEPTIHLAVLLSNQREEGRGERGRRGGGDQWEVEGGDFAVEGVELLQAGEPNVVALVVHDGEATDLLRWRKGRNEWGRGGSGGGVWGGWV